MKILVCVKQVPGSSNVEVDPVTGVLKRDGIQSKMNPYDLYGIEMALSLTEKYGGTVETITMGPPQAKSVIEESVCMGAVGGTVLSDRKFAGADVLSSFLFRIFRIKIPTTMVFPVLQLRLKEFFRRKRIWKSTL